ncbi:hypothetical protein HHL19_36295 [Streptomyces sp. R302]|uniref:hypothetical protein n=1 Tax=unclassified Streptomyces TaxID=2593676 RepID=UPI00145CE04C|nr:MULTISPECIES: hypothetical protein [unclassified Streptomyces]NML55686.1 hypothetical protein [Streptomyces sp. R301]NML83972.1 hypothetical protein [Streptomyces sp. R302]
MTTRTAFRHAEAEQVSPALARHRAEADILLGRLDRAALGHTKPLTTAEVALLSAAVRAERAATGRAAWQRDRLARILITATRAVGAPTYADLPAAARRLAVEHRRRGLAHRSARRRAAAAIEVLAQVGKLAVEWTYNDDPATKKCGHTLWAAFDAAQEVLWPSA